MHRAEAVKSYEVARLFERMADVLELTGQNPFRIRAYRRAAQNLESLSDDLETLVRSCGGRVSDSVSRKTGYVVVGTDPGEKLTRARTLGVPTIDEDAFLALARSRDDAREDFRKGRVLSRETTFRQRSQ